MPFYHVSCGGDISRLRRKCLKCGKKWDLVTFLVTPYEIRLRPTLRETPKEKLKAPKWATKLGLDWFVELMPRWPRWVRILIVLAIYGGVGTLIWWLFLS